MRYSVFKVIKKGTLATKAKNQRSDPEPEDHYDITIIGSGGHGLFTAYYVASIYGKHSFAVIEQGWIGRGNLGAIPRSFTRTTGWIAMSCSVHFRWNSGKGWDKS